MQSLPVGSIHTSNGAHFGAMHTGNAIAQNTMQSLIHVPIIANPLYLENGEKEDLGYIISLPSRPPDPKNELVAINPDPDPVNTDLAMHEDDQELGGRNDTSSFVAETPRF